MAKHVSGYLTDDHLTQAVIQDGIRFHFLNYLHGGAMDVVAMAAI